MKNPCQDCIHYDVCKIFSQTTQYVMFGKCDYFLDKSRIVELPCKVGDTVYTIENNLIQKWYIGLIDNTGEYWKCKLKSNKNKYKYDFRFVKFDDFGKTVFLTKKEAEARLKER